MSKNAIQKDAILTTKGITSRVPMDNGDDELIGHIALFDFDGATNDMIENESSGLDGLNVMLESSEGSYHLWNLTVRSQDATLALLASSHSDAKHTVIGYRRGRWVLRIGPKNGYDGETYKEAPELIGAWWNQTDRPQSLGHYRFARAFFGIDALPESRVNLVGQAYTVEKYMTVKDTMKELWADDGR